MVSKEIADFTAMLCTGIALGILFDMYRCLYRAARIRKTAAWFFDVVYLVIAIIFSFICLLLTNWAIIRFYLYMGIVSGVLIYYWIFSRFCLVIINKILLFIIKLLRIPVNIVCNIWRKMLLFIKKHRKQEKNNK